MTAGWSSTPENPTPHQIKTCPILITQKLQNKRRLRRNWHRLRTPESKRLFNAATRELKQLLTDYNNSSFQDFLLNLSPSASTNYSLWKAARKAKQIPNSSYPLRIPSGSWAKTSKEKAEAFANHLTAVFQPHPTTSPPEDEEALTHHLEEPHELELAPNPLSQIRSQFHHQRPQVLNLPRIRPYHGENAKRTTSCWNTVSHPNL